MNGAVSGRKNEPEREGPHTTPYHVGRTGKGTKSVKINRHKTMMPAPPMPWRDRPTNIKPMERDTQQKTVPRVKKATEMVRHGRRPNTWLRSAMNNISTALARRYAVPIQKPSYVLSSRSTTIAYDYEHAKDGKCLGGYRTCKEVTMTQASRATMSDNKAAVAMMAR
ncbi:hypothetical protein CABS01_17245 [Colletotrichum abscissum]|nr:uncharacterized protein CABS01_17245 [Colletotrichum abscissum]KAK1481702.1 hypothetical protein CABS01_17245 [Colletotrichum abscissum]